MSEKIILGGLEIRSELVDFIIEMEKTLRKNDYKTGWDNLGIHQLVSRIRQEYDELYREFVLWDNCDEMKYKHRMNNIRNESIDIAIYCMFLTHNYPKETE